MNIICRTFGHDASRNRAQLDPSTFAEHSHCKRCGAPLVKDARKHWCAVSEVGNA